MLDINQRLLYKGKEYVLEGWITAHQAYVSYFKRHSIPNLEYFILSINVGHVNLFSPDDDKTCVFSRVKVKDLTVTVPKIHKVIYE